MADDGVGAAVAALGTMFLFRSLTIGLLGACVMLLVQVGPSTHTTTVVTAAVPDRPNVGSSATIVDVAPGLSGAIVPSLIRLGPDERVVAVDDRAVGGNLEAGAAISAHAPAAGSFVDLEVATETGERRRVLVLMH